jgi:hypothetical protein
MFDFFTLNNTGRRPCPRCDRLMAEYLELCFDCQWKEAEAARNQETLDAMMKMAELEAREADRVAWQQERWEMGQRGGF